MGFEVTKENLRKMYYLPYGTKVLMHDTKNNTAFEGKVVSGCCSFMFGWQYNFKTPYGKIITIGGIDGDRNIHLYKNEEKLANRERTYVSKLSEELGFMLDIRDLLSKDYNIKNPEIDYNETRHLLQKIVMFFYHEGNVRSTNVLSGNADYISVHRDGVSIRISWLERNKWYETAEECLADNQPKIVRFEDDEEENKPLQLITDTKHNCKLADKINKTYYKHTSQLRAIMSSFAIRDKEMIVDNGMTIPDLLKCNKEEVYKFAIDFFMKIADDEDLKCVLHFFNE